MTGQAPATLVWLAPAPPDAAQAAALSDWALARGLTLAAPADEPPPAVPTDAAAAGDVEDLVERARDAIVAGDATAADAALSACEARLEAHPELPQAAWLMAEVERARSMRRRRIAPGDAAAADRAWARAEALDTGRVAGVGEEGAADPAARHAAASVTISVPAGDLAWLDGRLAEGGPAATSAGPHAVRVTSGGATVWAAWIDVPEGASSIATGAPDAAPCSSADTARAALAAGSAGGPGDVDARLVRCGRWVAAAPGATAESVRVALCEPRRCGPAIEWLRAPLHRFLPQAEAEPPRAPRPSWPAWATWTLAGAGAALATGAAIVVAGALRSPPQETVFVSGGLKTQ